MAMSIDLIPVGHIMDFEGDVGMPFQDFIESLAVLTDVDTQLTDQMLLGMAGMWRLWKRQTNPDVTMHDALNQSLQTLNEALMDLCDAGFGMPVRLSGNPVPQVSTRCSLTLY